MQWVPVWFCLILGWSKKHYYKVSLDTFWNHLVSCFGFELATDKHIFGGSYTWNTYVFFCRDDFAFFITKEKFIHQFTLYFIRTGNTFWIKLTECLSQCCFGVLLLFFKHNDCSLRLRSKTRITAVQCKIQIMFAIDLGQSGSSESVSFHLRSWHQSHWVLWCCSNAVRRKH